MRRLLILFVTTLSSLAILANTSYQIYSLTCEQLKDPMGIDTETPCFSWKLQSTQRSAWQSAYQILVADSEELLNEDQANIWNSGKINSDCSILIPFAGKQLASATTYYWKVRSWNGKDECSGWSEPATFVTGLMQDKEWGKAKWIALEKDEKIVVPAIHAPLVEKELKDEKVGMYQLPQFRKVFPVSKKIKQALVYVTGLGHFDFFLNGKKVGDHFLDPGWTKYDKEALYVTFDITDDLKNGDNVLGLMLGNGFYNIPRERYYKLLGSFGAPKMKLKLCIRYADGSTEYLVSDKTWHTAVSPITYSSIYGGEDYDATLEQKGWKDDPSFDDSHWQKAIEVEQNIKLRSQMGTHLVVRENVPVVTCYKNEKGNWIYDLGQNFSGIIRAKIKGNKGQAVIFRPAELQNADKTVNQQATGAPFYYKYVTNGTGEMESWQPQFSYYGFRYVQIEGAVPAGKENPDHLPEIVELEGLHTCNVASETGSFSCSKPMFNQIYNLIDWAIRSNMASVLTDCPHREKLGWLEQDHLMQYSMQYRYNLASLYAKIMDDMAASQLENGAIPTIAPEYVHFADGFEDTPEWGCSFIICPWYIYQWYGDKRLIIEHYPAMKKYLEYLGTRANNHIIAYGLGDWFDIGPKSPGYAQLTSNGVTATAIYYYNTMMLKEMAKLLGKEADEKSFETLAENIKKAYNTTFFHPEEGTYDRNSQTAGAISLYMDLVTPGNKARVLDNLIKDIVGRGNALTAGDVGYRYVLRALENSGNSDLIFKMNSKYDVPGYGWQLAHGATALTESWQAYENVSNNHLMLGHLMEWLFGGLGGIRQDENSIAYKTVLIDPQIVGDVKEAKTSYESPYGRIDCEWKKIDKAYTLQVNIPVNSKAVIYLPTIDVNRIKEYGKPITRQKDIMLIETTDVKTKWAIGSGSYLFEVSLTE
ncbi:glycoside hydrolase family 78 protein [Bacteroides sp.]|uniref:glycoside hydrolase family 78 protein n=1 Tax=Bacteroides sp. TaxID=29523 RepID=UPI0026175042|nr:glycoside hydrolase family 78 protein [Bacteroides sp.]MDD3036734.1 glycoside hydrolase family 78 protein [Bacteroides sp.]